MTPTTPFATDPARRAAFAAAAWFTVYLLALLVLRKAPPPTEVALLLALAPAPAFAWFAWCAIDALRQADELHRRVHLEALAFAFPAAMLLVMTLGLLELVIELPAADWSYRHLWAWFPPLYAGGLALAWRKYL